MDFISDNTDCDGNGAEEARIAALAEYDILDTAPEMQFERVVALARAMFDLPSAAISLIDRERQWFKAKSGLGMDETSRDMSFCTHTIAQDGPFVVRDATQDRRFADNPLVTAPNGIRFYAGVPLVTPGGHKIGTLCVLGPEPRQAPPREDIERLSVLADIVVSEMELHRHGRGGPGTHDSLADGLDALRHRLRISANYAAMLMEVKAAYMSETQLTIIAEAVWQQYRDAGQLLSATIQQLRDRLPPTDYRSFMEALPGFSL